MGSHRLNHQTFSRRPAVEKMPPRRGGGSAVDLNSSTHREESPFWPFWGDRCRRQSNALRRYLRRNRSLVRATCALTRVEVVRAVAPGGGRAVALARRQLARFHQMDVDRELLDRAAGLPSDAPLRSLDAVHLAAAQTLPALRAVVTYDARMQAAAHALGLPVEAPA